MCHIHKNPPLPFPGESVAVTAGVWQGCHLGHDTERREFDLVISGARLLVFMGERKRRDGKTVLILRNFPNNRHEEEVSEISLAGAA